MDNDTNNMTDQLPPDHTRNWLQQNAPKLFEGKRKRVLGQTPLASNRSLHQICQLQRSYREYSRYHTSRPISHPMQIELTESLYSVIHIHILSVLVLLHILS